MGRTKDHLNRNKAFHLYAKSRNVTKVSEELDITLSTLFVWKKDDRWDERIAEAQTSMQNTITDSGDDSEDNEVVASLTKSLFDQINSLDLMDQGADAAVANSFKDISLQQVIKIKEFTSKQRITLLRELKSGEKEKKGAGASTDPDTKDLEEKVAECRELKKILDRLDPGWDADEEVPDVLDMPLAKAVPIVAKIVEVTKPELEFTDGDTGTTE